MKKISPYLFFLIGSALLVSCKSSQTAIQKAPVQNTSTQVETRLPVSYSEKRKLDVAFTDGIIQKTQGNYPEAVGHFKKCLDIYPNHAASLYEIAFISNGIGKSTDAIPYAQKAASLDPNNEWYKMLLAKCYMESGRFDEASQTMDALIKINPDKIDYYFLKANSLLQANKLKEALLVYDKIETLIGITEDIILQKERIYLAQKQFDKAVIEAQRLINSNPQELKYYRMLADLYQQNDKQDKALEVFNKIFSIDPNDAEAHLMLADYYEKRADDKNAFLHVKKAFENPSYDIDEKMKILLNYFNIPEKFKEEREESDTLINILIRVHPQDAKTYSIQGDFLSRDAKYKEARDAFRKAIELDKNRYPIWQQVMAIDEQLGDFDAMESESKQAIELFPSEPYAYMFNASAHYQKKNYQAAIDAVNSGKDYVVGDKKLLSNFYSIMGDCYNSLKDYAQSDKNFEKSLNLDPDNANVMNNWAYYLSVRNEDLDKAEKMGRKANQLVKDNASYEDTYAWILYKQKNYDEAKRWQEKALQHSNDKNGTLLEHYGDIIYQLGQTDNALEYWQKAKATGTHSDLLDKKISDKKLYE